MLGFVVAAFVAGWIGSVLTRRRARTPAAKPAQGEALPAQGPAFGPQAGAADAGGRPLVSEVGEALRSDVANERMLSVMRDDGEPALSGLELDLADWGFTYGVAWARARERAPGGPDDAVAREALDAAESVFRLYTGGEDWTRHAGPKEPNPNGADGPGGPD